MPGTRLAAVAPVRAGSGAARSGAPDRLVERQVRPERQERGDDDAQSEQDRQPRRALRDQHDHSRDRQQGHDPAEQRELLERARVAGDEAAPVGRERRHLAQRPSALGDRAVDDGTLDDEPGHDGEARAGERPDDGGPLAGTQQAVREHERDRTECEMELPGQRDGDQRPCPEREPARVTVASALEAEQRQRDQERHQPEQVAGRLHDPVRREREGEPAGERRRTLEAERAQPPARGAAREDVREQDDDVPGDDRSEDRSTGSRAARTASPGD